MAGMKALHGVDTALDCLCGGYVLLHDALFCRWVSVALAHVRRTSEPHTRRCRLVVSRGLCNAPPVMATALGSG